MYYCSNPRPVEVVTFNASLVSPVVNLDWTTSSEVNSDYFEIERSVDGNPFNTIGRVDAAGYSVHSINYQLVDANPSSGTNYYRLKVVDLDGSVKYFKDIATIKIGGLGNGIKVYPVPTDNMLNVELMMSKDESIELSVYSLTGQQLMNETFILITGLNKLTTSLSSLPSTFQLIQM